MFGSELVKDVLDGADPKDVLAEARKRVLINGSLRNKANRALNFFNDPKNFTDKRTLPLGDIFAVLENLGITVLQEDFEKWSGMLTGRDGSTSFSVGPTASQHSNDRGRVMYKPYENTLLSLNWYSDQGRRKTTEIVVRLT